MSGSELTIVGIGASAGGLDAFHTFFNNMPADCGMAFVTILHLPADRRSLLPEILARWTPMHVEEALDGALIKPNCVYVPPPHAIVTLRDGRLDVRMPRPDEGRVFRPIDAFFDALAASVGERAVGIVLSGTGTDGALGLKAIKARGGLTIVQGSDGNAPQYREMPAGAIATGSVDVVAPIEKIPEHLMSLKSARPAGPESEEDADRLDAARLQICGLIRAQLGHDFGGYRDRTFLRRVHRRMRVVNAATVDDYVSRLRADPGEVVSLFRDLLIRVTSFFRDKETFETLETKVIPRLFAGKEAHNSVRIWVPGCATGEEAYSLAILLREYIDQLRGIPKVQLFATDIDDTAISTARLGTYPSTLLEDLSVNRRERFFIRSESGYIVSKEIRELCTFSVHNLVRDPPFSRMDLVSCRNLLIYMDTQLQGEVIPVFHYSLVPNGVLLLGAAESALRHQQLFEPLDKMSRIFVRRDVKSPPLNLNTKEVIHERAFLLESQPPQGHKTTPPPESEKTATSPDRDKSASEIPAIQPLHRAESIHMSLKVRFQRILELVSPMVSKPRGVEQDLLSTQEKLQSLSEEHQTALEELRSANEELHSVNEEMQSTNEELETSKEELQSINEELNTVNVRLSEKVDELDATNSDLRNLFESTEIATVFLDRQLIIRNFTPAIATLYNLIPSDQGRPLTDIACSLDYDRLREDVARVLDTQQPIEQRIARRDHSAYYIMRILPYRAPNGSVTGVLVTFVDVTSIVEAEIALLDADLRKDVFLATLSHELRNPLAPIRTAAQLLNSPRLDPPQLARVQCIISRQVSHMSSLLDDLLDLSRITRGAFPLKKEKADLRDLMDEAVEAAQPAIDANGHTLRVERPASPLILEVDPVRISQVISNLLTNAAKYTPVGGLITLGFRLEGFALMIFVRDNGLGLAPEMTTQIFDMFTRVDSGTNRSEGGLGIGLALVRGLVELHGGRVEARSAGLGQGSEFVVSLPASLMIGNTEQFPKRLPVDSSHPISRRVLIADDNRDGAETLEMLLKMSGHEVHVAHTGTEAFESASRYRPEFLVLDIGMPDLSGYGVANRIRSEDWGARMTLIALTGWGQEEDKRRAQAAGFDHHLTKPVDPGKLEYLLSLPHPTVRSLDGP